MAYSYQKIDIKEVIRGDAFSHSFEIGAAYNLTGKSVKMQVRATKSSSTVILEISTTNGGISVSGQTITLHRTAAEMTDLLCGKLCYDVQFYTNTNDVTTLFGGEFEILNDVTK